MPTVKLNRAIKYRAYPTEEQAVLLAKTFGCVRFGKMSYTTNNQAMHCKDGSFKDTIFVVGNIVHLPKVGNLKIKKHCSPKDDWRLKAATVSCTRTGKYFISLLYEFEEDNPACCCHERKISWFGLLLP